MEVILDTRNQLTFLEKDVILMGFGKRVCELLAVIASLLLIGKSKGAEEVYEPYSLFKTKSNHGADPQGRCPKGRGPGLLRRPECDE